MSRELGQLSKGLAFLSPWLIGFFVFMLSMGVAILRRHDTRQSVDIQ